MYIITIRKKDIEKIDFLINEKILFHVCKVKCNIYEIQTDSEYFLT